MTKYNLYNFTSIFLIALAVLSYFWGFYLDENSAGAGGPKGDIVHIWSNLKIYINNDIINSLNHPDYYDSRLPTAYLLHEYLNPFIETKIAFRRSVFVISLVLPLLFFLCLKQKFHKEDNLLLLLISSTVFLSPYFRTSAYWGLEENYGLIFLLLTFLSLNNFLNNENFNSYKIYLQIFFITFLSSCCFYFDQKLIIIPIICFFQILLSNKNIQLKLLTIFLYFLFSIPFIYLIILWGNIVHPSSAFRVMHTNDILLFNIGYTSSIIAFYIFPILFFLEKNLLHKIKNFFSANLNYLLIILIFVYLAYLMFFLDFGDLTDLGKGIVHKSGKILFESQYMQEIFTYFSFFVSGVILIIFLNRSLKNTLILLYFFTLSLVLWPILQEYFDPLILLMAFTFFNLRMTINYKNSLILYIYLSFLLVGSNIYYLNLTN